MHTTHEHPRPSQDRLTQYGAAALLALMLLTVPLQAVLALLGAPLLLFTALITLALTPFVLLLITATPAVTLADDGLTVTPRLWPPVTVPWTAVRAVKRYPLLPQADAEVGRRYAVGRKRYAPAEGVMLVIPALPWPYRFTGLFAGEGFTPVIAVTNRTHTDYDRLVRALRGHVSREAWMLEERSA